MVCNSNAQFGNVPHLKLTFLIPKAFFPTVTSISGMFTWSDFYEILFVSYSCHCEPPNKISCNLDRFQRSYSISKEFFFILDTFFQLRGQIWVCSQGPIFMKFCMTVIHVIVSPQTKFHEIWTSFRGVKEFLFSLFSISHASVGF